MSHALAMRQRFSWRAKSTCGSTHSRMCGCQGQHRTVDVLIAKRIEGSTVFSKFKMTMVSSGVSRVSNPGDHFTLTNELTSRFQILIGMSVDARNSVAMIKNDESAVAS